MAMSMAKLDMAILPTTVRRIDIKFIHQSVRATLNLLSIVEVTN